MKRRDTNTNTMNAEKKTLAIKDAMQKFLDAKLAEAKLRVPCDLCSLVQVNMSSTIAITSKVNIRIKNENQKENQNENKELIKSMCVCSKCLKKLIPEDTGRWDIAFFSKTSSRKFIEISANDLEPLESVATIGKAYAVYRPNLASQNALNEITCKVESIEDKDEKEMSGLFLRRHNYLFRGKTMIIIANSLMALSKLCLAHTTQFFGSKKLIYRLNRRAREHLEAASQSKVVIKVVRDFFFTKELADIILGYFSHAVEIVFCNQEIKKLSQRQIRICAELKQNTIKAKETIERLENLIEVKLDKKTVNPQIEELKRKKRKQPNGNPNGNRNNVCKANTSCANNKKQLNQPKRVRR